MKNKYDAIVVGAGPAGSRTAKVIADQGCEVVMLEKRQEIGVPVRCGEGISLRHFKELDIMKPDSRWIARDISTARLFAPNGRYLKVSERYMGDETGCNIYRDIFDKVLASAAADAGADIELKTAVVDVLTKKDAVVGVKAKSMGKKLDVRADVVVDATGFESQLGRWAGIDTKVRPRDIVSCLQYTLANIDIGEATNDFHMGKAVTPGGYAWVFPREDSANVGLGVPLHNLTGKAMVKRYLDKFVAKHYPTGKVVRIVAGAVSACAPIDKTVGNGIVLVGDAARQVDPLTGGGVLNALIAGSVAGEVIAQAVEAGRFDAAFLDSYERGWREQIEDKLYRNWLAKEKAMTLSDDMLNKLIDALASYEFTEISTIEILKAVQAKHPELVEELESLL